MSERPPGRVPTCCMGCIRVANCQPVEYDVLRSHTQYGISSQFKCDRIHTVYVAYVIFLDYVRIQYA